MRIATWNLNNRIGKVRFRREAAEAAIALEADVIVFTEFFPQQHEDRFRATLARAGWEHQSKSAQPKADVVANRVFIASKMPMTPMPLALPTFDDQLPANLLGVVLPSLGLTVLGIRVPAYQSGAKHLLFNAWEWIEATAASLAPTPALILGDLNVSTTSPAARAGDHFRRIMASGWRRAAAPRGATCLGHSGRCSEIDHILGTGNLTLSDTASIMEVGGFTLAGSPGAISDHAALICDV